MGATTYTTQGKGTNVNEVFRDLVEEAIHYYGHGSYNGTISTTRLSSNLTHKIPEKILKNEKKLNDFINDYENNDEMLYPRKWETTYIELGVAHYEAFAPEWIEDTYTPKREKGVTTVQLFSMSIEGESNIRQKFDTLSEAKKKAKEYSLLMDKNVTIYKHRSNGERFRLGHIRLTSDGKKYKSARTAKTKIYKPIKEFMFFVYAAC